MSQTNSINIHDALTATYNNAIPQKNSADSKKAAGCAKLTAVNIKH